MGFEQFVYSSQRTTLRYDVYMAVEHILITTNAKHILDVGSGSGSLASKLTSQFNNRHFDILDKNPAVFKDIQKIFTCTKHGIVANIADFSGTESIGDYDLLLFIWSYASMSARERIATLQNCFKNMQPNSFIFIVDFLPEENNADIYNTVVARKADAAYNDMFWHHLCEIKRIDSTRQLADRERAAMLSPKESAFEADSGEYLTIFDVKKEIKSSGFTIIFENAISCYGDRGILIQKRE